MDMEMPDTLVSPVACPAGESIALPMETATGGGELATVMDEGTEEVEMEELQRTEVASEFFASEPNATESETESSGTKVLKDGDIADPAGSSSSINLMGDTNRSNLGEKSMRYVSMDLGTGVAVAVGGDDDVHTGDTSSDSSDGQGLGVPVMPALGSTTSKTGEKSLGYESLINDEEDYQNLGEEN